jgi:hypothetical protein
MNHLVTESVGSSQSMSPMNSTPIVFVVDDDLSVRESLDGLTAPRSGGHKPVPRQVSFFRFPSPSVQAA